MSNNPLDERIVRFMKKHHVLTLATSVGDEPYCTNMFYVYMPEENILVYNSLENTKHIEDIAKNSRVGGAIFLNTKIISNIKGVQMQGVMKHIEGDFEKKARKAFLKRFPYAAIMTLNLWAFEPSFIKLTDNAFGFGTKVVWNKK